MSSGNVNYMSAPFGVYDSKQGKNKGLQIRYASDKKDCGIILYERKNGSEIGHYPFERKDGENKVYELFLKDISLDKISYLFYEENRPVIDKRALMFEGADTFGKVKSYANYRSISVAQNYNWEGDTYPHLSYSESVGYCLHVRGFTQHKSSQVKAKGTFRGITEKIPYLKNLGITTLELQPAYEFVESAVSIKEAQIESPALKLNYWGYKEAFYYVPKRAYTYGKDSSKEFKDMVKELHRNHMELVMQFYFPDYFSRMEILPILRYWHQEYHVDGFHLKGNNLPICDIVSDAYLNNAKIWCEHFHPGEISASDASYKRLAVYNDEYLCNLRGFLKSDINMAQPAIRCMMRNPKQYGIVNYLTNYYGFTMADMVCFQEKHNESNGEENRDGTNYNCSWNCGVEGLTRKKNVLELRKQQLNNAFALLFLSQGMPLFFMGDEFGNSQKGNNNPYCQDNEITWLDWKGLEKNKGIYDFVKQLITMRKRYKVFSKDTEYTLTDYLSLGMPDLSYHDEEAWKYSWQDTKNSIGFMLNGDYAEGCQDSFWYVALNMHWEEQNFSLPDVGENYHWILFLSTNPKWQEQPVLSMLKENCVTVEPRCICIFLAHKDAPGDEI